MAWCFDARTIFPCCGCFILPSLKSQIGELPLTSLTQTKQPLNASTANPSAASAALSAFSGHRRDSSSGSLSAAAAAAALRARPTTPTNVAHVQTKRTARRSASGRGTPDPTSNTSSGPPVALRRQSSSGSMSERTFRRSPSPGVAATAHQRSLSSGGTPRTAYPGNDPPPPVPALPESVNMAAARARLSGGGGGGGGATRPMSLPITSTPVKTASQRMAEKNPKEAGGSWFLGAKVGDLGNMRTSDAIMTSPLPPAKVAPPAQTAQQHTTPALADRVSPDDSSADRSESRGSSVNFSYPARVRVASPTGSDRPSKFEEGPAPQPSTPERQPKAKRRSSTISPQRGGSVRSSRPSSIASVQDLVYDPNSRRMVPQANLLALEYQIQAASEKKQKKKKSALNRAGSHLARGTMGRSHGTAVHNQNDVVPIEAAMAAAASLKSHRAEEQQPQSADEELEEEHGKASFEAAPEVQWQQPEREAGLKNLRAENSVSPTAHTAEVGISAPSQDVHVGGLQRRPSVVREEEHESESEEDEAPNNTSSALDAVPVRHSIYAHGVPSPPQSENTDDQPVEVADPTSVELAMGSTVSPAPAQTIQETRIIAPGLQEAHALRRDSRNHSKSPVRSAHFGTVQEAPTVKHEPPARSLSPRKSALKQSSPSRGASPRGDRSESSSVDTPTQEPPVHRKKSVRVSFDDENTVVVGEAAGRGETDSPVPPSPQQAPGTGKRPWYNNLGIGRKKDVVPLEEDEVMKPRPALPSFGSVRERKHSPRPAEERPLVRPYEPHPSELSGPEAKKVLEAEAMGHSSDHAVGAIIQERGSQNGANISKVREPLPPVVTSIEGDGYASESGVSSDDESILLADTPRLEAEESQVSQASTLVPEQPKATNGSAIAAGEQSAIDVKDFGSASVIRPGDAVPVISITQPSPRPVERQEERSSYMHFPGEFPETDTETDGEHMPARQVTFEPVVQQDDAMATSNTPGTVLATQLAVQQETADDDSDGSSVYSDAYEDLAEIEGDGFQSLDAVVETPMLKTPPKNVLERAEAQRAEAGTPTLQPRDVAAPVTTTPQGGSAATGPVEQDPWAAAKAYWRSLTADKRAQLEKEAAEEAGTEADLEEVRPGPKKPRRKKSVEQRNSEKRVIEEQRAQAELNRSYMIKPGTKAGPAEYGTTAEAIQGGQPMPKSTQAQTGMRLRKTMRAADAQPVETETRMRKSMRAEAPERTAPKQRAAPHQPLGNTTEVTGGRRHRALSETTPPSLRRRGSDSSTSSFKRARPMSSGLGFRKTMRTGTGSLNSLDSREQQPTRFSLRGASPPGRGASPPVSMGMGTRMRTTLRGEQPRARRSSEDSGKGYLRFSSGRGLTSDKKGKQRSRFGDDSSDEDEAAPRRFASRFEDSSDEDDVLPAESLSPSRNAKLMRGARGNGNGNGNGNVMPSPPLPEEEDLSDYYEDATGGEEPAHNTITSGVATDGGRPSSRRSGFMSSVLRRNNKKQDESGNKISRSERKGSIARRNTDQLTGPRTNKGGHWPLGGGGGDSDESKQPEESTEQITPAGHGTTSVLVGNKGLDVLNEEEGSDDVGGAPAAVPRSPSVLGHARSQPTMGRPAFRVRRTMSTASGTMQRSDTADAVGDGGGGSEAAGSGRKKKKFGALRRMFKLDD